MYSIYTMPHAAYSPTAFLSLFSPERLLSLARLSGFVVRTPRKVDLRAFLLSSMILALQRSGSLRLQSILLGMAANVTLSKQGLHKRLTNRASAFLQHCLAAAIAWRVRSPEHLPAGAFQRILVQDSTCLSLPAALASFFPGPSNQTGQPQASLRIQCLYDLLSESFVQFLLCPFTRNDQCAALDALDLLRAGDLLLRDLGYFTLSSLRAIASKGAFFLTRRHSSITLCDPLTGLPLDLASLLPGFGLLDIPVLIGQREKIPARLLAFPLPEDLANQRRRKALANRDRRLNPSKAALYLLGWNLLLTNADPLKLPAQKAANLYRLRWRIEIIFKSWKTHFGLLTPSRIGKHQAEVLVYGLLLFAVLSHHSLLPLADKSASPRPPSLLRFCQFLGLWILPLLLSPPDSPIFSQRLSAQLSFHCLYDKRRRPNYFSLKSSFLS
jgi:hypothetical protein